MNKTEMGRLLEDSPSGFNEIMYQSTVYFGNRLVKFSRSYLRQWFEVCGPGFFGRYLQKNQCPNSWNGHLGGDGHVKCVEEKFKTNQKSETFGLLNPRFAKR
jgi:hypothetical protein